MLGKEELGFTVLLKVSGSVQAQRRPAEAIQVSPKEQSMDHLALNKKEHSNSNKGHLQLGSRASQRLNP